MFIHFFSELDWLKEQTGDLLGFIIAKVGFFILPVIIQYGGYYILNLIIFRDYIGFFVEFLLVIVVVFFISTFITHRLQQYNLGETSIIFNSLFISWIAAGLLPF
jgi:hypothetical protein